MFDSVLNAPLVFEKSAFCKVICDKVFKDGPNKVCGIQPLKNLR